MEIKEAAARMKKCAPFLAASEISVRNDALRSIAKGLKERREEIFKANAIDMENADKEGIADSVKKRLKYDENKLRDSISGLEGLIGLDDPLGKLSLKTMLDDDLILERISVPIGVIGVIFEARPDAMVQVASLCIKSGNCAVLKGGKETLNSNRILFEIITEAVKSAGIPEDALFLAESHSEINELLKCDKDVDLIIPRGSNKFVRYIMENTKIPVMGHSAGICHIFVDDKADLKAAIPIIIDAKIQYAAACNAIETLLVHKDIAKDFLPVIGKELSDVNVRIRAFGDALTILKSSGIDADISEMGEDEFDTEYNDLCISVKVVSDVKEAVEHINHFGSHHTDSILTTDEKDAQYFEKMVDSAGVYVNCSTRFADGYRYGFGAEVGISTGKLHARGPVGLEGLVTYKYILKGNGQIVGDYASGNKNFKHIKMDL